MEAAAFPNRLRALDLSQSILVHMAKELEFQLGDIIRAVTANTPSTAMATYQLLQRRLARYKQLQRHLSTDVQITVRITTVCFTMNFFNFLVCPCRYIEGHRYRTCRLQFVLQSPLNFNNSAYIFCIVCWLLLG